MSLSLVLKRVTTPTFQHLKTVNISRRPQVPNDRPSLPSVILISSHLFLNNQNSIILTAMFSSLTTKLALRKAGISTKDFSFQSEPTSKGEKDQNASSPFAKNPFATLSLPPSLKSWQTPPPPPVEMGAVPIWGTRAPTSAKLRLPGQDGRPTVIVFLRHCGCPCLLPILFDYSNTNIY